VVITRDPVPAQPSAVPGCDRKSRAAPGGRETADPGRLA